jgi:hypothetical protein
MVVVAQVGVFVSEQGAALRTRECAQHPGRNYDAAASTGDGIGMHGRILYDGKITDRLQAGGGGCGLACPLYEPGQMQTSPPQHDTRYQSSGQRGRCRYW